VPCTRGGLERCRRANWKHGRYAQRTNPTYYDSNGGSSMPVIDFFTSISAPTEALAFAADTGCLWGLNRAFAE
jgi:hypothetical protein